MKKTLFMPLLVILTTALLAFSISAHSQSINAKKITPVISFLLLGDDGPMSLEESARFLTQSTFGPTYEEVVVLSQSLATS